MHTFDIRFEKSLGLAGLFEAPANRLGWKGSGKLSIEAQGIRIAAKRGLLTLFSRRSRRFPADSITEAYREGDSLRLVFGSREHRESLAVWTRGGVAAEIVKLLPTSRTVELDHSTDSTPPYHVDWRVTFILFVAAAVVAAGLMLLFRRFGVGGSELAVSNATPSAESLPGTTSSRDERAIAGADSASAAPGAPDSAAPAAVASLEQPRSAERTAPVDSVIATTTDIEGQMPETMEPAPYVPPRYFATYVSEMSLLRSDYYDWKGRASAESLRALENRWWELTVNVYYHSRMGVDYGGSLEARTLAISRAWRNHLAAYAESLRTGDQSLMPGAQAELELAEKLMRETT